MAEEHTMALRWSGDAPQADAYLKVAQEHGATVSEEKKDGGVHLTFSMTARDLQALRDRVDALLVAFTNIEDSLP